jgi:phosphoribosylamine--glycine ligase
MLLNTIGYTGGMKSVLVVGSGGREHALAWKLAQSPGVSHIYIAPGNGGTSLVGENVPIEMTDIDGLLSFALEKQINFTVIGQEAALELAVVDRFTENGLAIFGPTQAAARLETSKAFTADFLERHDIARPESFTATKLSDALSYIQGKDPTSYVIKADGLATGKGVVLPETEDEAKKVLESMMSGQAFGKAGDTVVFQERLHGQEVSAFALSDGSTALMLPFFQDHKQVNDGDQGPNTGGMGAYTPLPFITSELAEKIRVEIMQKTVSGMKADGNEYRGVVYAGLFVTEAGEPKVIEYNARFGDPEAQAMMLALDEDLLPLLEQSARGEFEQQNVSVKESAFATVALASGGYPGDYKKGLEINGLEQTYSRVTVFHAGTKKEGETFITNGGRVLNVTASGADMKDALAHAYAAIGEDGVHFENMHYRTDIGYRVL